MITHHCRSQEHPHLLAVSDLHVAHQGNADIVSRLRPAHPGDWLLVAGDVAEESRVVLDVLAELRQRFARVIWVPGNHELWTHPLDRDDRRGLERYEHLVRHRDVLTPEVPYPTWQGTEQQFAVVPCLLLYDFTFRGGAASAEDALALAREVGHVFVAAYLLHRDPYPSVADWSRERVRLTEERLSRLPADRPITLPNHYLVLQRHARVIGVRTPTPLALDRGDRAMARPVPDQSLVYGHLHIPTSASEGDVAFEEVSCGYPREHDRRCPIRGPAERSHRPCRLQGPERQDHSRSHRRRWGDGQGRRHHLCSPFQTTVNAITGIIFGIL